MSHQKTHSNSKASGGEKSNRKRGSRRGRRRGSSKQNHSQASSPAPPKSGRRVSRNKSSKFGGREPKVAFQKRTGPVPLEPFELFCLYYMGVTDDNRYRRPTMKDTAKRIGIAPEQVELALRACGMDKHTLRDVDFDLNLAQEDVRVAPEGIDKREIARTLFHEFCELNPHFVNKSEEELTEEIGIEKGK